MGYDKDEYYEDDEMAEEEEGEFIPEDQQSKFMMIMGTSYGISFLFHVLLLVIAGFIVFLAPRKEKKAIVIAKREVKKQEFDEELKRDLHKTPKIVAEKPVEKPVVVLEEEVEITKDVPKGTDMSNMSNKNLDSTSVCDAYGAGGGAAGAYGQRWGKGALAREGGSAGTESAVEAALRWLKRHQSPDGRWDGDGWQNNCKKGRCSGPGANEGDGRYDVGITGLALLAYLGAGHTHRFGTFKRTVNKGLRWVMKQQKEDGSIAFHEGEEIYNHGIATMALCEAFAVSRDFKLKRYAEKAINFIVKAQNPGQGWKYGVKPGNNDTSVTGWMVLALKAAKTGNIKVPDGAFSGALAWFKRATLSSTGAVGYQRAGGGSSYIPAQKGKFEEVPCMTAVSVICRVFAGEKASSPDLKKGAAILMKDPPTRPSASETKKTNFYYWYYGTYAMFQIGGQKWKQWNKHMQKALLPYNRQKGCEDGSWDPVGEWCIAGGRVYATAINALTLEIYYRYERAGNK